MKKIFLIIIIFILQFVCYPIAVSANIICNDGTISPSCANCHRGCCSHHGGCSNRYSGSYEISKKSDNVSLKSVKIDSKNVDISDKMYFSTDKESVSIYAVTDDSKATLDYAKNVYLILGDNLVNIRVISESGKEKNYELYINREQVSEEKSNIKDEDNAPFPVAFGIFCIIVYFCCKLRKR